MPGWNMEEKQYEVEMVYRQRAIYRIQAPDDEAAKRVAARRWQRGDQSDVTGHDWCELEFVEVEEEPGFEQQRQDDELVLRFIRERERLLLQLGGGGFNPTMNDAISATQVASDLGWRRRNGHPTGKVDTRRASRTLERNCRNRKLVCFERPRSRTGERGGIRLYCTPEYLERLSASIEVVEQQAG